MNILITGANRGIGLEFVRQYLKLGYTVYATCREPEQADELQNLKESYADKLMIEKLDVCDDDSIKQLSNKLSKTPIDILLNNAGTMGDSDVTIGNIDRQNFLKVFETNCLSVVKISEAFLAHLKKSSKKLIVIISSDMGSITANNTGRSYAYRGSKAALNAVMRSFAIDVEPLNINVLLLHPGWVRTRMGGENGNISAQESVSAMIAQIERLADTAHAKAVHRFDTGEPVPY